MSTEGSPTESKDYEEGDPYEDKPGSGGVPVVSLPAQREQGTADGGLGSLCHL